MADQKISQLNALLAADALATDLIVIAHDIGGTPETVKMTVEEARKLFSLVNVQEFSGSGTWNKPANGTFAFIELWGGGGSGGAGRGGSSPSRSAASGGGGGEYVSALIPLALLNESYSIIIGPGGSAAVASASGADVNGVAGGNTSFGSLLSAFGGAGGLGQGDSASASVAGVSGGSGGATDFITPKRENGSSSGAASSTFSTGVSVAGTNTIYSGASGGGSETNGAGNPGSAKSGGNSDFGGDGGAGAFNNVGSANASPGQLKGGGGGGATCGSTGTATSGAGGSGFCRVTVF